MTEPTIILEAAFGGQPGSIYLQFDDTTRGKFDTGIFAPGNDGFIDLSSRGRRFSTSRGRARALDQYQPGRASIVFSDNDDALNPNNLSGPYVAAGQTEIAPMVAVRIRASFNGTIYPIWQGFADSWMTSYPGTGKDAICTVSATDGFKVLGAFTPGGPSAYVGGSEDSGARIARLLTNAGWNTTDRDLDTGNSTVQATALTLNALSECQGVADSEQGYLFMSKDGKVTFRNRHSRITGTRSSTSQADFGNHASLLPYADIVFGYDDLLIKNTITGTINGGTAQTFADSTSVGSYLTHTYNATGLWLESDLDALYWAQWLGQQFTNPELRVDSITLNPYDSSPTSMWATILGLEIGDLVTVSHLTPSGATISRSLFVEGIDHQAAPGRHWTTRLSFSSATVLQSGAYLIFDSSTLGKFNTGKVAV